MLVASYLVFLAEVYAAIGGVVAAVFLTYGIDRIDPSAAGTYSFRPLLAPGLILLWPLVVWRWRILETLHDRCRKHPVDRPPLRAHGMVWRRLAVVLPLIVVAGLVLKAAQPSPKPPIRLAPPSAEGTR